MIRRYYQPLLVALLFVSALLVSGCSSEDTPKLRVLSDDAVILAFGDSLTYGTGADHQTESYPAVLAGLIGRTVVNAGVPGEVSSEGLNRLRKILEKHQPDLVLLCHGGNDLIRKLDETALRQNLAQMVTQIREYGAEVVVLSVPKPGVFLKPAPLYLQLATEFQLPIANEIIADVESKTSLKSDAIHPNAAGYKLIAEQVYQLLSESGAL
jgi:lysophospholipase L1-like esterase